MMKPIDIKPQPPLSLSRLFNLTLHGIRYRLFRSAVTVAVIAVAVSFLMNVFVQQQVCERAMQRCRQDAKRLRLAAAWSVRLQNAGTLDTILKELAEEESEVFGAEARRFAGWDDAALQEAQSAAAQASGFLAFLDELDYGRRRRLVGDRQGVDVFAGLQEKADRDRFFAMAAEMKSVRLPQSAADLGVFFAQRWPALRLRLEELRAGRQEAIARLQQRLQGRSMLEALADAAGKFGEEIRSVGFAFPAAEAAIIAEQAAALADAGAVENTLAWPEVRKALAARLGILPSGINADNLWEILRDDAGASWYLRKAQAQTEASAPSAARLRALDAARLRHLAGERSRLRELSEIERYLVGAGRALAERLGWLLLVSLILCTVGIANAMLMSVTERFREIATLKCLGALDLSILWMFVFEACLLGAVGGVIGAVLGLVIGLGRMLFAFGGFLFAALPTAALAAGSAAAIIVGIALAAIASVYPSLKAARLAPMEAMRIE